MSSWCTLYRKTEIHSDARDGGGLTMAAAADAAVGAEAALVLKCEALLKRIIRYYEALHAVR